MEQIWEAYKRYCNRCERNGTEPISYDDFQGEWLDEHSEY